MIHIFGGLLLVGIIIVVLDMIASVALFFTPFYTIVSTVISALLFSAISYVFSVVLYRDLNARRGESSLDSLMVG
jgi:hypothetical protein